MCLTLFRTCIRYATASHVRVRASVVRAVRVRRHKSVRKSNAKGHGEPFGSGVARLGMNVQRDACFYE